MFFNFFLYFLIFYAIILLTAATGFLLIRLWPVPKGPEGRMKTLFISILAGMVFWVFLFSSVTTLGKTVNIVLLITLLTYTLLHYRKSSVIATNSLKGTWLFIKKNALIVFVFSLPLFAYEAVWFLRNGDFPFILPFVDYIDMYNISQVISLTGQENNKYLLSNFYYPQFHGMAPYHFFELWVNGLLSFLLPLPGSLTLMLFVYPYFYVTTFFGFMAAWETHGSIRLWHYPLTLLLLFTGGMYFEFYKDYELLKWYGGNVGNIAQIWGKKASVLYPVIIYAYILFWEKRTAAATAVLLTAGVLSVGVMPGITGGVFLFILLNKWHKTYQGKELRNVFIIWTVFSAAFVLMYILMGNKNEDSLGFAAIIKNLFAALDASYIKTLFFRFVFPILRMFVIFSPFFLLILYIIIFEKAYQTIGRLFLLVLLILSTGAVIGTLASINLFSGAQFFGYLFPVFLVLTVFSFTYLYKQFEWRPVTSRTIIKSLFLVFFVLSTSYNIRNNLILQKHYKNVSEQMYSYSYLNSVTNQLNTHKFNPLGVCFTGADDIKNYPLNSYGITGLTFSGMSVKLTNRFHAVSNLSIFDVPVDTSDVFSKQLYRSFEFYNFVEDTKSSENYTSVESAQLAFIKHFAIDYALIYKSASYPDTLNSLIEYEYFDPVSGQRFVVFKH